MNGLLADEGMACFLTSPIVPEAMPGTDRQRLDLRTATGSAACHFAGTPGSGRSAMLCALSRIICGELESMGFSFRTPQ